MSASWRMSWMLLQGQLMRGRKARGWSQADLAARLGVGRRTIQRWEDGTADCSSEDLFRWSSAVGVSIISVAHQDCATSGALEAA